MKQSRFKSPIVWGAIVAQLVALGQMTGLFARIGLDGGLIADIGATVLQLLVIVGVLNNPEEKDKF